MASLRDFETRIFAAKRIAGSIKGSLGINDLVLGQGNRKNARATFWWMRIVEFLGFKQVVQELS